MIRTWLSLSIGWITQREHLALVAIAAVALVLRLWGICFGLPYEYHVDEVQYVRQAASMGSAGLEPVWWNNPPFFKYMLLAEFGALFVLGRLAGIYASVAQFGAVNELDPTHLYLVARATTAIMGTATVVLVYALGNRLRNRLTGLVAALLLATCFIHVRDSHFAVNDIPLVFWVTLAVLLATKALSGTHIRWYLVSGVAVGVAFATKYTGLLAALPVVVAALPWFSRGLSRKDRALRLGAALAGGIGAAIVCSPYFVITPGRVIADVRAALYVPAQAGFEGWEIDPSGGYLFYLKTLVRGMGWVALTASVAGMTLALSRHRPVDLMLLLIPLSGLAILGSQQMYFARFILPIVPLLCVFAADGICALANHWCSRRALVPGLLLALAVAQPLASSVKSDMLLTRVDTRTLAKEWIEANIPAGSRIATDWPVHSPPLSTPERAVPDGQVVYDYTAVGGIGLAAHPLAWYHDEGYEYLVTTSFISDIPLVYEDQNPARNAFYASLPESLDLVAEFSPGESVPFVFDEIYGPFVSLWQRERPGPTVKIYAIP